MVANSDSKIPEILFDNIFKHKLVKKLQTDSFFRNTNIQFTYFYSNVQNAFTEKLIKNTKTKSQDFNYFDNKVINVKEVQQNSLISIY